MQPGELGRDRVVLGPHADRDVAGRAWLELDRCHVWEHLPDGERLLLRAGTGWDPDQIRFLTVPMDPGTLPGYTLVHGGPVLIEDFATDESLDDMYIDNPFDLLGLFQGVGLPFRAESAPVRSSW